MNTQVLEATSLMENLPVNDQNLVLEMIKKLVLAWDPDYTKLTKMEEKRIIKAENEFLKGDVVEDSEEIWQ